MPSYLRDTVFIISTSYSRETKKQLYVYANGKRQQLNFCLAVWLSGFHFDSNKYLSNVLLDEINVQSRRSIFRSIIQ